MHFLTIDHNKTKLFAQVCWKRSKTISFDCNKKVSAVIQTYKSENEQKFIS